MITKDRNLRFLQKKIGEIKTAIFKTGIDQEFQLPDNIITTLNTDDEGNIWFFSSCKGEYAKNIDLDFYASLEYYQKGSNNRILMSGKVSVMHYNSVPLFSQTNIFSSDHVLIRFKMMRVEYFETRSLNTASLKTKAKKFFNKFLSPQQYREFYFPEQAI